MSRRKITYRKVRCTNCGNMITRNALGRAAHERSCYNQRKVQATYHILINYKTPDEEGVHCFVEHARSEQSAIIQAKTKLLQRKDVTVTAITDVRCEDALRRHHARIADHVDGYDRDDLGENPDY